MKLNHINLVVQNVAIAVRFFEQYFGFACQEIKGDHIVAVLKGADDFTLVLMAAKDGDGTYPAAFHIGFMQSSVEAVQELYQRLKEGGIEVGRAPAKIRDSYGFYFMFGGVMIEVGCYES